MVRAQIHVHIQLVLHEAHWFLSSGMQDYYYMSHIIHIHIQAQSVVLPHTPHLQMAVTWHGCKNKQLCFLGAKVSLTEWSQRAADQLLAPLRAQGGSWNPENRDNTVIVGMEKREITTTSECSF